MASSLGGGAAYDPATGTLTAPSYSVSGTSVNNVGDALTNLDGRTTQNTTDITALGDQLADGTIAPGARTLAAGFGSLRQAAGGLGRAAGDDAPEVRLPAAWRGRLTQQGSRRGLLLLGAHQGRRCSGMGAAGSPFEEA